MSDYAQTPSEAPRGPRCNKTRNSILNTILNSIESEKNTEKTNKKLADAEKKFGRNSVRISELRNAGKEARIAAIPLDLTQYETEQEKNCYRAGFVENGNRLILGNLEKLSPEQLEAYGSNDYISGLELKEIPDAIKSNQSYIQGYKMASIMNNSKGKRGR